MLPFHSVGTGLVQLWEDLVEAIWNRTSCKMLLRVFDLNSKYKIDNRSFIYRVSSSRSKRTLP